MLQLVPNWNSNINPVATPTAKLTPNSFIQNLAVRFQNSLPVITYKVSIRPMITASPNVRGTKSQWYMAVRANCALDQSIIETSILSNILLIG